jgi:hypothetical protein
MGYAHWDCRKHSAAVVQLFGGKSAPGACVLNSIRHFLGEPIPIFRALRSAGKEANHAPIAVDNRVGCPASGQAMGLGI